MSGRPARRWSVFGVALAVVVATSGCSLFRGAPPKPSEGAQVADAVRWVLGNDAEAVRESRPPSETAPYVVGVTTGSEVTTQSAWKVLAAVVDFAGPDRPVTVSFQWPNAELDGQSDTLAFQWSPSARAVEIVRGVVSGSIETSSPLGQVRDITAKRLASIATGRLPAPTLANLDHIASGADQLVGVSVLVPAAHYVTGRLVTVTVSYFAAGEQAVDVTLGAGPALGLRMELGGKLVADARGNREIGAAPRTVRLSLDKEIAQEFVVEFPEVGVYTLYGTLESLPPRRTEPLQIRVFPK